MPPTPFQRPTGTRDFYPIELARRRWIEDRWRRVSVRHGFEEIEGPVFEHLDLYRLKSGEGIVSELFQAFSGKDEAEIARIRQSGQAPFALRPEFTPTLARMYAAKAGALPKPTKWFSILNYFRAERPQRGRLREFLQWNVDQIGDEEHIKSVAEVVACCVGLLMELGLSPRDSRIRLNDRGLVTGLLQGSGVSSEHLSAALSLLDRRSKLSAAEFAATSEKLGLDLAKFDQRMDELQWMFARDQRGYDDDKQGIALMSEYELLFRLREELERIGIEEWCDFDPTIVRGLAYYTGTVFEVIAEGERAVAGGGRYDKLIELLGGPPTPAVGFAMGDVVLSLLLQDKGLMPSDDQIARDLDLRPDVFVIPSPAEGAEALIAPTLALLRKEGLHARRSYKSTRNVGKLLKDAAAAGARLAVILESPTEFTLKNLDTNEQTDVLPMDRLLETIREQ